MTLIPHAGVTPCLQVSSFPDGQLFRITPHHPASTRNVYPVVQHAAAPSSSLPDRVNDPWSLVYGDTSRPVISYTGISIAQRPSRLHLIGAYPGLLAKNSRINIGAPRYIHHHPPTALDPGLIGAKLLPVPTHVPGGVTCLARYMWSTYTHLGSRVRLPSACQMQVHAR